VFKLGGKVSHVTHHVRQLFKVKGHKVTHKKFMQSRDLALVMLESKLPLIVVVAQEKLYSE